MRELLLVKPVYSCLIMNTLQEFLPNYSISGFKLNLTSNLAFETLDMTFSGEKLSVQLNCCCTSSDLPEKEKSLADSHVAKLLFIAFEEQKVVDPGKQFQSALKNGKKC